LQSLQILYTFVVHAEIATIFGPNVVALSACNTKVKSEQNLQTLQDYIFRILQHFATNLSNRITHSFWYALSSKPGAGGGGGGGGGEKEILCFRGNTAFSTFLCNMNFCNVNYEENVIGLCFKKTKEAFQRK
jgi:hypothetical protein